MVAVAGNTFRGFHRVNKALPGAAVVYQRYFVENRARLLRRLIAVQSRSDLQRLSNDICDQLRAMLTNLRPQMLRSYNRIRKPVDLYLEHLVAMSADLDQLRAALVPLLFLPLDTQILGFPGLFCGTELRDHGLARTSGFGAIRDEKTYTALQGLLTQKARVISQARYPSVFHVINFDLLWGGRGGMPPGELFVI